MLLISCAYPFIYISYKKFHIKVGVPALEKYVLADFQNPSKKKIETMKNVKIHRRLLRRTWQHSL